MATSGTYAFTLDLGDVIEEAYERVGRRLDTGYDYQTARRSLDMLLLEWQNRGLNLWTIKDTSVTMVAGQGSYDLSEEKLDVIEATLRTNAGNANSQTDISMKRLSISNFARKTNKLLQGRPTQFWIERKTTGITMHVWPVPDSADYAVNYYYMTRIEDTGKPASNNINIPVRYLPALTAGLAYYLGLKTPQAAPMMQGIKAVYDEQWELASDAARDKASFFVKPGGYRNV